MLKTLACNIPIRLNELTKTFTDNLFVSCITVNTPGYSIRNSVPGLTRRALADTMVELDAMDAGYIRLSQLVLQRKIPKNVDGYGTKTEHNFGLVMLTTTLGFETMGGVLSAEANSGGGGADYTIASTITQSGGAGASNTIDYNLQINTTDGSPTNAVFYVELLNFNSTGITMAAV